MKIFITLFSLVFLFSCNQERKVQSKKGGLDIITNIYYNASKGLDQHQQIIISKMNYRDENVIELVPNINLPEIIDSVYYLRDTLYYKVGTLIESKSLIFKDKRSEKLKSVKNKKYGAIWVATPIFNYEKRKNLSDTILYGKKEFKRFQIFTKENYSIFYINKTDTILPYSLNQIADKDYGGRLERIDSYDKKRDLFVTVILLPRKNWDAEAQEIFDFNENINKN